MLSQKTGWRTKEGTWYWPLASACTCTYMNTHTCMSTHTHMPRNESSATNTYKVYDGWLINGGQIHVFVNSSWSRLDHISLCWSVLCYYNKVAETMDLERRMFIWPYSFRDVRFFFQYPDFWGVGSHPGSELQHLSSRFAGVLACGYGWAVGCLSSIHKALALTFSTLETRHLGICVIEAPL